VVVFQHQQSLAAGYEAWVKSEGDRLAKSADGASGADSSSGRGTGFISLTTLCCGKGKYLLAFRFADYHSTMHWLRSEERKAWASKGEVSALVA
jgi:antibiotic biosynthesis monooxygenase (ABM) superfamily enzyme